MSKISFEHVSLIYQNDNKDYPVLQDMNFSIQEGEFVSLIGSSGCGKSTTLNLLAGLQKPTRGQVKIDGKSVEGPGKDRGVVFQHYSLFPWMKARKNIEFGIRQISGSASKKETAAKAEQYLKLVGLEGKGGLYPYQLSGGMQQRVAIARTLAMEPDILLMDEPFGAIDARNRVLLQELLLALLEKEEKPKTVLFVTHDIDEAILLSDRILFLREKRIFSALKVPFGRPRKRQDIIGTGAYIQFRKQLFSLFGDSAEEPEEPEARIEGIA